MLGLPEVFWLIAAAVMGKAGFNYIKTKTFALFKKVALPQTVSRPRYYIGLILFLIPFTFGWIAPYIPELVPMVMQNRIALGGDILLLVSLFVLGGDFWDKLMSLFMYRARVQVPERH